jgi:type II secretion system protein G
MTNDEKNLARIRSYWLTSPSTFGAGGAFTLIEVLVVIAIIIVLAGLVLSTVGYVQKKGERSRAETEIAAMSAACESYKADNGIYPRESASTDVLNAQNSGNPTNYQTASLYLYKQLSGDSNANLQPPAGAKTYFSFKPQMLDGTRDANGNLTSVTYIRDPFRNSYGYSTIQAATGISTDGYNPTFDLWSTTGLTTTPPTTTVTAQWIKNW